MPGQRCASVIVMELTPEELESLAEQDAAEQQLLLGWAYLRRQLRRALAAGDVRAIDALAAEPVVTLLRHRVRQELGAETPRLQIAGVDWLGEETVLYSVIEEPSQLSAALVGSPFHLHAQVSLSSQGQWRLETLGLATSFDSDHRILDAAFSAIRPQTA
jgi:hypothetical protein